MSADSAIPLDSLNDVRSALGAVRGIYGEYAEFFSGVFSRLESVSEAAQTRQQSRDRQLQELQRQQQLWDQDRAILERELEAVRNRAAELNAALAQQKREAEMQQSQWAAELKQMRRTLQQMARRLAAPAEQASVPAAAEFDARPPAPTAGREAEADPVLDSVVAQFQLLQSDSARRRKANG